MNQSEKEPKPIDVDRLKRDLREAIAQVLIKHGVMEPHNFDMFMDFSAFKPEEFEIQHIATVHECTEVKKDGNQKDP